MMIGTWLRRRIWRHTSIPEIARQHHVEQHHIGLHAVELLERLDPVHRHLDGEPLARQADLESLDEARLVLDDEHGRSGHGTPLSAFVGSTLRGRRTTGRMLAGGGGRDAQHERAALTFARRHLDVAAVVGRDVAHDRQAEARPTGVAAARLVDAVEALEDPVEVAARDARALVGDHELDPRPDDTGPDLDEAADLAVLDGVLDQVADGGDELTLVTGDT